jgi:hypothetical protein
VARVRLIDQNARMRSVAIAALAGTLTVLAVAGCGSSDNSAGSSQTGTTTTTAPANARLSQASWETYLQARSRAQAVNGAATKKFRACRSLIQSDTQPQQVQSCLGDAPTKVVSEGQQVTATLDGFQDEVGGACRAASQALSGYVKGYIATINALNGAIDRGDVSFAQQQIDEASRALAGARASQVAFEAACKPAG